MFSAKGKTTGRAVLSLCLCLMMAAVFLTAMAPADALAGAAEKAGHAVEKAEGDFDKSKRGDLSVNDPEFDWAYALYTLIIRFVGIFVVLGILQVVMQISGRIFISIEKKKAENAAK